MTREEALFKAKNVLEEATANENAVCYVTDDDREWIEMAIKALELCHILEQEPCDDAISRQAVLDMMQMKMGGKELYKTVYDLPPVTPQPKTGHWIRVDKDKLKCSECEVVHFIAQYPQSAKINYCPNCGAKMVESEDIEPQESEDKK